MADSRFIRYSKRHVPKQRKRIKLRAAFEETGKWLKCWNCGFTVNVERDLTGADEPGTYYVDVILPSTLVPGDSLTGMIGSSTPDTDQPLIPVDAFGNPPFIYTPREHRVSHGCPFCGTENF